MPPAQDCGYQLAIFFVNRSGVPAVIAMEADVRLCTGHAYALGGGPTDPALSCATPARCQTPLVVC
jgi:hypothetical protein